MVDSPLLKMLEEEPAHARRTDPATSKKAARRITPGSIRHKILKTLETHPEGLASYEVSQALGRPRDIVAPNFAPLVRMGLIALTGKQRINPGTNFENDLYVVTEKYFATRISRTPIPNNKLSAEKSRKIIKRAFQEIERQLATIRNQGFSLIPGYHWQSHRISSIMECAKSPVGMCVYTYESAICFFCGGAK